VLGWKSSSRWRDLFPVLLFACPAWDIVEIVSGESRAPLHRRKQRCKGEKPGVSDRKNEDWEGCRSEVTNLSGLRKCQSTKTEITEIHPGRKGLILSWEPLV